MLRKMFDVYLATLSRTALPPTLVSTGRPTRQPSVLPTRVSCNAQGAIGYLFADLFCYPLIILMLLFVFSS